MRESFFAFVASQNSNPSLRRRLSLASPPEALAGAKVVEPSSSSAVNESRGTWRYGCDSWGTFWCSLEAVRLLLLSVVENRGAWMFHADIVGNVHWLGREAAVPGWVPSVITGLQAWVSR